MTSIQKKSGIRATIRIAAGSLVAEILPSLGGGVASFDLLRGGRKTEIFRSRPKGGTDDPNFLGLYVLIPWSNRISGRGFNFDGTFHPLLPNAAGEPCPIHGDGWLAPWQLLAKSSRSVTLNRETAEIGPYRYRAVLDYALDAGGMTVALTATNLAAIALPFGLGFHPWLPRTPATTLRAPAETVWLEDSRHLPTERVPVQIRSDWDFTSYRSLPDGWINNGFLGWNGRASIRWEDRALALEIEASPLLSNFLLYSPGAGAPFFCFEPVTHAVDAHNLAPGPEAHGLVVLAPEKSMTVQCRFSVRDTE
jgi:aldose 1-epimerase